MKNLVVLLLLFINQIGIGQNQEEVMDSLNLIIKTTKNDSLKSYSYVKLSVLYRREHKLDSSLIFSQKAYDIADKRDFDGLKGQALLSKGMVSARKTNYSEALTLYQEALGFLEKASDNSGILAVNANIGSIYFQQNTLEKALPYYLESIKISEKIGDPQGKIIPLFNISLIYFHLKSYDKSLEYCLLIDKVKAENNLGDYFSAYLDSQYGALYSITKEYDKALPYFNRMLETAIKNKDKKNEAIALIEIGDVYLHKDEIINAENKFKKAIEVLESLEFKIEEYAYALTSLAEIKLINKAYDEGIRLANKSLEFAKNQNQTEFERDAHEILAKLYEAKSMYMKAYNSHLLFKSLSDSISKAETLAIVSDVETKYQTQQKENKILKLTNEKLVVDADLRKSRIANFGLFFVFVVLLIFGYFIWNKRKQAHKLALLENSVKSSEAEKSRIGKALHDGIAGSLMKLVHDSETAQIKLSHKLLQTYNEVRDLSHQLDNTPMHNELFYERIIDIIPENTEKQQFSFNISPKSLQIKEPVGTHIFRIIQELITNNLKHAKASETIISINHIDQKIILDYKDDGIGFKQLKKGKGLKNIEDRLVLINASIAIESNNGFKVKIEIPYNI